MLHTHLPVKACGCIPKLNVDSVGCPCVDGSRARDALSAEPRADAVRRRDTTHIFYARKERVVRWRFLHALRAFLILGEPGTEFPQGRVVCEDYQDIARLLRKHVEACQTPCVLLHRRGKADLEDQLGINALDLW